MSLTWNDWSRRTAPEQLKNGELGDVIGIMPIKSTNIQRLTDGNGIVYYQGFVLGDNSFMATSISGAAAPPGDRGGRPMVRVIPKSINHATIFGNVIRVVGKFFAGASLIDDTRMVLHQVASSS